MLIASRYSPQTWDTNKLALDPVHRALDKIATCEDPKQLKQIAKNAGLHGESAVRHAAELKLYAVLPSAQPGTLQHDVWQSVYALEGALAAERGKTVLLARTRQKIARDGEQGTVASLVLGKVSDGFRMLLDRNMPELTFEAVALMHAADFSEVVLTAAKSRLVEVGYTPK